MQEIGQGSTAPAAGRERPVLSVVLPVFNEEETLPELYRQLTPALEALGVSFEVVLVNDGSRDGSLALLKEIHGRDPRYKYVSLSRNFGHQIAISAGTDYTRGEAVVVMDADLQDSPAVIGDMMDRWREGYDVVYAVRETRQDSLFKRLTAAAFYRVLQRVTNINIPVDVGDFRLMSRRAVDSLKSIKERHRFVRGLVSWIGYRQIGVPFQRGARYAGETKYPLRKMLKFAFDGLTSFSFKPLQLATYFGFFVSSFSFLFAIYVIWLRVFTERTVQGWTSLMVAVLFLGGIQLISLGVIGEYIGRIYDEVKQRPLYLVEEADGFDAGA